MRNYRSLLFLLFACTSAIAAAAQPSNGQDVMRSNGKIYVVMTVVIVIITGLLFYVINTDRKISKLEKRMKEGNR
jgi:CcmD family protein